jgi:hypothetical protein
LNRRTVLGLAPIIIIALLFGVYVGLIVPTSTTSSVRYFGFPSTAETTNSTLGLKLVLSANSTTIPSEDSINLFVSVLNILPKVNNLTASTDWVIQGLRAGPCDYDPHNDTAKLFNPVGIAIFNGYYNVHNISSALPLPIWATVSCPVPHAFNGSEIVGVLDNISSYSLFPKNDSGFYTAYYSPNFALPAIKGEFATQINDESAIYAANSTGFSPYDSLLSSLPSVYTVAAGDEWGQFVLLHFQVVPSNNLPKVGEFLSSTGECAENGFPVPCITYEFSQAFIFNCASEATTTSGCTTQVTSYTIIVWYPYVNQTNEPASANCMFSVKGYTSSPYGHCFSVNSTAFALSPQ